MTRGFRPVLVSFLSLALAACNETASDRLATGQIILRGELVADGASARMNVDLGKEGSSVVVVLQGGDSMHAGDGLRDVRMDYSSDLLGSHYRATFPLDVSAPYSTTLLRFDGSSHRSAFPALPPVFAFVAPVTDQTVVLASSPTFVVAWDSVVSAQELELAVYHACDWQLTPAPPGGGGLVSRGSHESRLLTSTERATRQAVANLAVFVNLQSAELAADHPGSTVVLQSCDSDFSLVARNRAAASPALSGRSRLVSRREVTARLNLVP